MSTSRWPQPKSSLTLHCLVDITLGHVGSGFITGLVSRGTSNENVQDEQGRRFLRALDGDERILLVAQLFHDRVVELSVDVGAAARSFGWLIAGFGVGDANGRAAVFDDEADFLEPLARRIRQGGIELGPGDNVLLRGLDQLVHLGRLRQGLAPAAFRLGPAL